MQTQALLDELRWRELLHQHTEHVGDALNAGQVSGYIGFDPTAPSLHVGSLLQIMLLVHLQRHGHRPVALVGGGTGLIGDPSGRKSERPLASVEVVAANTASIRTQLERFLDFDEARGARMIDNADWLVGLRAVEFMRDVGKHFTVNYMLQKESVKARLDEGISYTEFSYMLLQAFDYLELNRRHGVTLQLGGSDQWGNITAGMELIRRTTGSEVHGITSPLVTTSAGTKFGKTEAGAVWLDGTMTSPYKFYQFWVNIDDRDSSRYLRYFTLFSREEIEALDRSIAEHPEKREAQYALARDVTRRVHGEVALAAAEEVSSLLFGGGDPRALSNDALALLREEIPSYRIVADGPLDTHNLIEAVSGGVSVNIALSGSGTVTDPLFKSKGDARRLIQQGGVYLNGQRLGPERRPLTNEDLLVDGSVLLRKGGKSYAYVEIVPKK